MSENNESGNRWEKSADAGDGAEDGATESAPESIEVTATAVPADAAPVAALAAPGRFFRPAWMTTRGLIATAAAAAFFVGGGGVGYAVGVHHDGASRQFPSRFDRAGFDGRTPGGGQFQGGDPGQGSGQAPESQGQSSQSGSGSSSGASS